MEAPGSGSSSGTRAPKKVRKDQAAEAAVCWVRWRVGLLLLGGGWGAGGAGHLPDLARAWPPRPFLLLIDGDPVGPGRTPG